jgi:hypothetical protein
MHNPSCKGQALTEWIILSALIIFTWAGAAAFACKSLATSQSEVWSLLAARRALSKVKTMPLPQGWVSFRRHGNAAEAMVSVEGIRAQTFISVPQTANKGGFLLLSSFPFGSWFSRFLE